VQFKKSLTVLLCLVLMCIALYLFLLWQNNKTTAAVSHAEINRHFEKAIDWLETHYSKVEHSGNPILWWMVRQASENSNNPRLTKIYKKYLKDHIDGQPTSLSSPMFDEYFQYTLPDVSLLSSLDEYQVFLLYSINCDDDFSQNAIIQKQLEPDYCPVILLQPRCITHQLMGLRFMQRYQCGYEDKVRATSKLLYERLLTELTLDFRVTDAYIQRVLMLVDGGKLSEVKPVWIRRILDAQRDDGGWGDQYVILSLGENTVFALTSKLPQIAPPRSQFHTTAQALWLLSLLNSQD
jgi:hypothetical protein